jgi:hypothetical protein
MEVDFSIDVSFHGPIFTNEFETIIDEYCRDLEDTIGDIGVSRIQAYLPTQYKYLGHNGGNPVDNPVPANAGFLQSQIHTERQVTDAVMITDTPVVYGPWIEGVSMRNLIVFPHRRNPPPRRFPGYHSFRVISQTLNADAEEIALRVLPPYLLELNS